MTDIQDDNKSPTSDRTFRERVGDVSRQYFLVIFHLFIAIAAFVAAGAYVNYVLQGAKIPFVVPSTDSVIVTSINAFIGVFSAYFPLVISVWIGFRFAGRANTLMRAAFYEQTSVVPLKDFDLIKEAIKKGEPAPITEYIRLVSLTGGVGIFQKIGLTGLPLVTLGLVVFFSIGVMIFRGDTETFKAFLDFTKLTLGAFIGSFVQRQVENRSRETELQRAIDTAARGGGPPTPGGNSPPERPLAPAPPSGRTERPSGSSTALVPHDLPDALADTGQHPETPAEPDPKPAGPREHEPDALADAGQHPETPAEPDPKPAGPREHEP